MKWPQHFIQCPHVHVLGCPKARSGIWNRLPLLLLSILYSPLQSPFYFRSETAVMGRSGGISSGPNLNVTCPSKTMRDCAKHPSAISAKAFSCGCMDWRASRSLSLRASSFQYIDPLCCPCSVVHISSERLP